MAGDKTSGNPFFIYSSKIKRLIIPVPGFKLFHKASDENSADSKFIGREKIISTLMGWLSYNQGEAYSGSYLITGYRGMGKSSFVGKVLNEISAPPFRSYNPLFYLSGIFFFLWNISVLFPTLQYAGFSFVESIKLGNREVTDYLYIVQWVFGGLFGVFLLRYIFMWLSQKEIFSYYIGKYKFLYKYRYGTNLSKEIRKKSRSELINDWKKISKKVEYINKDKKYNRLIIRINLGHEVLQERDILSLIASNIYQKYRAYLSSSQAHPIFSFGVVLLSAGLLYMFHYLIFMPLVVFIPEVVKEEQYAYLVSLIYLIVWFSLSIGFYYLCKSLCYKFLGISTNLKKLKNLNERIESSIHENDAPEALLTGGLLAGNTVGMTLGSRRRRSFPIAGVREIENELNLILEHITQQNFREFMTPKFIIIFDEMDKIDPEANYITKSEGEPGPAPKMEQSASGISGGTSSRRRKQNVLRLLANMKLFVSSANAKFIFIAGRELYDAFLADLSDREFAISSIFNGVIYVESFLTSHENKRDITSMTENYICNQLIPASYIKKVFYQRYEQTGEVETVTPGFKLYYSFLVRTMNLKEKNKEDIYRVESLIIFLYHFSVYLSHISNGSPKKIGLYFEKYVREYKEEKADDEDRYELNIREPYKYVLSFGYVDQRKIGFIHYIAFPVVQAIIDNASMYGDKLLVSASFLVDHIYKHHSNGFSWRNLEHTPELLEVYRTPELREFIDSILSFLSQTHLSTIISGLYQLKFRYRISEEISILSKFSEEISAVFNFTLDESLSVKNHYNGLLEYYTQQYKKTSPESRPSYKILAGIHHILADLHMLDEEYTEAIFEYQRSTQLILTQFGQARPKANDLTGEDETNMLVLIRNMLKLGLAFERRKTFNSAYMTYSKLVSMLVKYRYIDEKDLGLEYMQVRRKNWKNKQAVLYKKRKKNELESLNNMELFHKETLPLFQEDIPADEDLLYSVRGKDLIIDMSEQLTPIKSSILIKLSLFEDIRLVYQASLAKLFVLEKIELGGITIENLKILESEYIFLHLATNEEDKFIISADFFRKLADIMYYKNGLINHEADKFYTGLYFWSHTADLNGFCSMHKVMHKKEMINRFIKKINIDLSYGDRLDTCVKESSTKENEIQDNGEIERKLKYIVENQTDFQKKEDKELLEKFVDFTMDSIRGMHWNKVDKCNWHRKKMVNKSKYIPCYACKYYNRSLGLLANYLLRSEERDHKISKAILFYERLRYQKDFSSLRSNYFSLLGHSLDGLGNVIVSCSDIQHEIGQPFLRSFFKDIKESDTIKDPEHLSLFREGKMSKMEKAILYYWDASEAFKIATDIQETSISLKKILSLILEYVIIQEEMIKNLERDEEREATKDRIPFYKERIGVIAGFLDDIKKVLVNRTLQNLYSHYEYVNMSEIQKIKWIFSIQMYNDIPLHYLSLFPDIEEIMVMYHELCTRCSPYFSVDIKADENKAKQKTDERFKAAFIYSNRLEGTAYGRVMLLRYKTVLNDGLFTGMLKKMDIGRVDFNYCSRIFPLQFYQFLEKFLDEKIEFPIRSLLTDYPSFYYSHRNIPERGTVKDRLNLLEFLVNDNLFCLTKILETVTPFDKSTLFTNSFVAETYDHLYKWNQIYELIFLLYRYKEVGEQNIKDGKIVENEETEKIIRKLSRQINLSEASEIKKQGAGLIASFKNCANMLPDVESEVYKESSRFFFDIMKQIDKSNVNNIIDNYLAEMAIKKYRRTKEMHSEGKAYKDMINNMYLLDDDLSNDTCQFSFAIERYKINCDYIDHRIRNLRNTFKETGIYDINTYFKYDIEGQIARIPDFDE